MNKNELTILIVDDNVKNIQVVGSVLRNENYKSGFAMNGKQALKMLEKTKYDLVLLDVNMPEMDGFETCKIIRNSESFASIPIVFLTADVDHKSKINGFKVGGQDYVTKPFNSEELLARVQTQLELKHSKDKLLSINQLLEEKVKERTAELSETNKKLEEANRSLLELDQAKSEFMQLISHEIMTPLNGVLGFSQILRSRIESEELIQYIDALEESANRLHKFSNNAVMMTSLKLGRYNLKIGDVFFYQMIDSLIDLFSDQAKKKNIKIQNNIPENISFRVDKELMFIGIRNLIENAIRFSHKDSVVMVNLSGGDTIDITDEGPGFSDKALENLFKFFSPGEAHIDKNEGIGLAFSNLIVKAHSGEISVKNLKPKGALVKVKLPSKNSN